MNDDKQKSIDNARKLFEQNSVTYFNSTQLFPEHTRDDITILYGFVRIFDNFVDTTPQQSEQFFDYKKKFHEALDNNMAANDLVLDSFLELMHRKKIEHKIPLTFLKAMEQDLTKATYQTLEEVEDYMVGSAEVIGVMMAKILDLPHESIPYARLLGKSMQFINFIRDINHDLETLNRVYIPLEIIQRYDLANLEQQTAAASQRKFTNLIRDLIQLYFEWQVEAEVGFKYISRENLIPIKTASDMYKWTANQIYTDPFIIYRQQLKPTPEQIIETAEKNMQQL